MAGPRHLYDNNGAPASFHKLSFEEYHTNSWLGQHGDAICHSTTSPPHGSTDNISHACIIVAPTYFPAVLPQAPDQTPACPTFHGASFSTAGVPIAPQLGSHDHDHGHQNTSHQASAPPGVDDINQGPATLAHPHQDSVGSSLPPTDPNHSLKCCNYIFRNDQTLRRHRREVKSCLHYAPGTAPVYTCHWCYSSFKRRSTLDQHLVERCRRTADEARKDLAIWYPR